MAITEEGKQRYNSVVKQNNAEDIVRIGSFNVSTYRYKSWGTIQFAMELMMDNYIDMAGIQEFGNFKDFNGVEASKIPSVFEHVSYNPAKPFLNGSSGIATVSHHSFLEDYGDQYTQVGPEPCEQRRYSIVRSVINGKNLFVYNTHLEAYSGTVNSSQFDELTAQLRSHMKSNPNDYFVVVGDFNSYESCGDYDKLRAIGFSSSLPTTGLDNVFYSSNISLLDSRVVVTPDWVTDHELVFAELRLN